MKENDVDCDMSFAKVCEPVICLWLPGNLFLCSHCYEDLNYYRITQCSIMLKRILCALCESVTGSTMV